MQATIQEAIILTMDHLRPRDYILAQNINGYIMYETNLGHFFTLDVAILTCESLNRRKYSWDDPAFVNGGWFVIHKVYYNKLTAPE